MAKLAKAIRLLARPRFTIAALRHRVAAAVEHLEAIGRIAPATIIDVGANKGQFSLAARARAPAAHIIAFEPLTEAADIYARLFARDQRVALHRFALSEHEGNAEFHVTDRSDSSSLLTPGSGQSDAFGVHAARTIAVPVRRLDAMVDMAALAHPILLKIDVQGAELQVLKGCADLGEADFVYVELSYVELYEGQPLVEEVSAYLGGRGFVLDRIFNPVATARFGPTQADFLFRRER
jgi:FkbM family methyltransferase